MIRFGKMVVEGFASIVDEEFDWGIEGLNIIQAPNGYGKTKFINALVWCIFGKTLTGSVEPWPHTRPSSYRGTRVVQHINIGLEEILITRYKDYPKFKNSLILRINNKDPEDGDKADIQKEIEKIIGYTYDLFKNSIIFGQKLKRIISETGPNKKKVFDDAFEIAYIPKAKKLAEGKLTEFRLEESKALNKWELVEEKIRGKESEVEAERKMVANFEIDKKKDTKEERRLILPLKRERNKLFEDNEEADLHLYQWRHDLEIFEHDSYDEEEIIKKEKELTKLETNRDNILEAAQDIQTKITGLVLESKSVPDFCDKCKRLFTKQEKLAEKKLIQERIDLEKTHYIQATNNLSTIKGQIKELDGEIASANECNESIVSNKKEIERLEEVLQAISDLDEKIQGHKDNIKNIKKKHLINNITDLEIELRDLKSKLRAEGTDLKKIQRDVKTNEWLIKDPLSNAGLKAFIFNEMLDDINERLEFYTKFIGFHVAFLIDMQSAHRNLETYVFKDGEPVPYDDLSGGQQQSVDIVTAFAIDDVVSDTKECMLLVMDEVFEYLDKDNIEIMTELIQDKAQSKCLYLVTHRAEFSPTNANIIYIDFKNGITSLAA